MIGKPLLITLFRKRVREELKKRDLTVKQFSKAFLRIPEERFRKMLKRKTLRLRWVDLIAEQLEMYAAQLLCMEDLEINTAPPSTEIVSDSIVAALSAEGLSASDVAASLNISRQALSKELTAGNIGLERLNKIAAIADVEPWQLVLPAGTVVQDG